MVFLGDDEDVLGLEDVSGTVDAFVGGESGVVHEDVFGGDALFYGVVFHGADFIVVFAAVVAAHDELGRSMGFIEFNGSIEALSKHRCRGTVFTDSGTQDEDAVGGGCGVLFGRCGISFRGCEKLVFIQNLIFGCLLDVEINSQCGGNSSHDQAEEKPEDSFGKRFFLFFHLWTPLYFYMDCFLFFLIFSNSLFCLLTSSRKVI